jgi:hypothetical protein
MDYLDFISPLDEAPIAILPPKPSADAYIGYYFQTIHRLYLL